MIKSIRSIILVVFISLMILFPCISHAGPLYIGEWGVGNFNYIIETSSDPVFESPGMDGFRLLNDYNTEITDWTGSFDSTNQVSGSGAERDDLAWYIYFSESYADTPFSFDIRVYLNDNLLDWATINYNGGEYGAFNDSKLSNWENYEIITHPLNQVPEPFTMLLLGFGLMGLAGARRKFEK
ncbi:MAG: PEP-CTERM sorting domain-containing protein [Syntrophaceae bacterium]|nr:PEP-CTERM sorting domain-containing protein [Syntrophaceae bacterium]